MADPSPPAPASPPTVGAVDALILCALQDELEGVLALGGKDAWQEHKDQRGFRLYRRTFDNGRGGKLRVAAAWAGEMGRVAAATRAQQLIGELSPACLAMCGICAGVRSDVSLGDVIIADRLYDYDTGKHIAKEGDVSKVQHEFETFDLSAKWKMEAAFLAREIEAQGAGGTLEGSVVAPRIGPRISPDAPGSGREKGTGSGKNHRSKRAAPLHVRDPSRREAGRLVRLQRRARREDVRASIQDQANLRGRVQPSRRRRPAPASNHAKKALPLVERPWCRHGPP